MATVIHFRASFQDINIRDMPWCNHTLLGKKISKVYLLNKNNGLNRKIRMDINYAELLLSVLPRTHA